MADPVSIIGGVVGVASLGIQVTQTLIDFYNAYRHQNSDLASTLHNLEDLTDTLRRLEEISVERTLLQNDQFWVERIQTSIANCNDAIEELEERCQKLTGTVQSGWKGSLKKAAYPFKSSTLQKLEVDVKETRANLHVLLGVLQVKATAKTQDDLDEMKALMNSVNGKQILSSIREWLNAPDATVNYNLACAKKHPGSGRWLLENSQFSSWLTQDSSFLWLVGFAGSGKSVLCSTAIQSAFRHRQGDRGIGIAFFYFAFNDISKQDVSSMLRALLWQLSSQAPDGPVDLSQLYESHKPGTPPTSVLLAYLQRLIARFHHTYIFVDALDECPRTEGREGVMDALEEMGEWNGPALHLFVTSRDESDIRQALVNLPYHEVVMRNTGIDSDIADYVSCQLLNDRYLSKLSKYYDQIQAALTEGAKGVCPQSERLIQKKLKSLPQSLDATYERIFCNIDNDLSEDALRILTLLCFAYRPLTTRELIDGIAVEAGRRTGLDRSRRLSDVDDIRKICPGLVEVGFNDISMQEIHHTSGRTETVRIAHFSVQEYLISTRIRGSKADKFSINPISAHSEVAQGCLAYLLEEDLLNQSFGLHLVEQFPFAHYAAMYWYRHYKDAGASIDESDKFIQILFQSRPTFVVWIKLHDIDQDWDNKIHFDRRENEIATSSYYASLLGLEKTVSILINQQPATATYEHVNKQGGRYGNALQAASSLGHQEIVQILLDKRADVNAPGGLYGNALSAASFKGHQEIVQILLDKGGDVNAKGGPYGNALYAASERGYQAIVQMLLDKEADVNAQSGIYGNALSAASEGGHQAIVQMLLDKEADVNAQGGPFRNALQVALNRGYQKIVQILLDKGADINAQNGLHGNALYEASERGYQAIVQMLLDKEADVNAQNGLYSNALSAASFKGHQKIVQMLLDKGADVNAQGRLYGNALQAALSGGHQEIVQVLLDKGADINAQGGHYGNALQAASSGGHQEIVQVLLDTGADVNAQDGRHYGNVLQAASSGGHQEIVQVLLDKGADINAQGGEYGNALSAASFEGHEEIVQILLDKGADVNAQGGEYGNALSAASFKGHQEVVQVLLDKRADVNAQGGEYGNALSAASFEGHEEIVQILLDKGADINAQGGEYGNALQAASFGGHQEIVQVLLDKGADVNTLDGADGNALIKDDLRT